VSSTLALIGKTFQAIIGIGNVDFVERGEPRYPVRKNYKKL